MKIEKLRGYDDTVRGYKLGNWYLLKKFMFGNESTISWYICDQDYYYQDYDEHNRAKKGITIEWVYSYRAGIAKLKELNN